MACEFICDGCGKRAPGEYNGRHWFKPHIWFERSDSKGVQTVCSRECVAKVAERTGVTSVVLPI